MLNADKRDSLLNEEIVQGYKPEILSGPITGGFLVPLDFEVLPKTPENDR